MNVQNIILNEVNLELSKIYVFGTLHAHRNLICGSYRSSIGRVKFVINIQELVLTVSTHGPYPYRIPRHRHNWFELEMSDPNFEVKSIINHIIRVRDKKVSIIDIFEYYHKTLWAWVFDRE